MTLLEMSVEYGKSADLIARRLRLLRELERRCTDETERTHLHRRILDLRPMQQQCRDLQKLTAHYYDRSFTRDERYCL